jgi:DNA phosphorothioation system restriction enzyme
MPLNNLNIPKQLDTSTHDFSHDFFSPVLAQSVKYDRGVGYFSSGWIKINSKGMIKFANNGGIARWVTSPIMNQEDWDALALGNEAHVDDVLYQLLKKDIDQLVQDMEYDTLSALAWMVADGIITIKLALPRNKLNGGDFHDKFGIFTDKSGNRISFNGSYNDSIQGTRNYESIKVFNSWEPMFEDFVEKDSERFENLWENKDLNVKVYDFPEAAKNKLLRLRDSNRPYKIDSQKFLEMLFKPIEPCIPDSIMLRDYQEQAIQAWFDNDYCGLFEMATGTGKTITSLAASVKFFQQEKRIALVIACPYQHLVDQWEKEAKGFSYKPIRAYMSRQSWMSELNERINAYNHKDINHLCVITTHKTYSTEHFYRTIGRIQGSGFIIADEVHHLGSENQKRYFPQNIKNRLALSATPNRWFDEEGTQAILNYFGQVVFRFSLSEAIAKGFLTPYYYYPVLVELTETEMIDYAELSKKIVQLYFQKDGKRNEEYLTQLLIKRAQLLNNAKNKITTLSELIDQQNKVERSLFYCAPGQIDDVVSLLGWNKRLFVHRFTAKEDMKKRAELLEDFASGRLNGLVAMHCLDEGVDVPSTRTAYILASSSNPREFIQRRGRILRKSPGKDFAIIYDLITIPSLTRIPLDEKELKYEKSMLKRELKRFTEFADSAINSNSANDVVWNIAKAFNILDY